MTKTEIRETEISQYYGDGDRLKAVVSKSGSNQYFVDFYKDDVMIDSRQIEGRSLHYAEDMAENYVNGIIRIDPHTWRVHGV